MALDAHKSKKRYLVQEAKRRLLKDYNELVSSDCLYNANAAPTESDMFLWHFNIKPADDESKFKGILLHGTMKFPADYPLNPPEVCLSFPIEHDYVTTDSEGRNVVCLGVLEQPNGRDGWNSSYSVLTVLVALQSLFSAEYSGIGQSSDLATQARETQAIKAAKHASKALKVPIQPNVQHSYKSPWPELHDPPSKSERRKATSKCIITNIRSDWNVAKGDKGVKYGRVLFEAKIEDVFNPSSQQQPYRDGAYFVPSSTKNLTFCRVGWGTDRLTEDMSYGVFYGNGSAGHLFVGESDTLHNCQAPWGQNFGKSDVITTAVDFDSRKIYFAKNGVLQGESAIPKSFYGKKLFPVVGLMSAHVELNFGKPNKPTAQLAAFECIEDHTKISRAEHLWDNRSLSGRVKGWNALPECIAQLGKHSPRSKHCRDPDGSFANAFSFLSARDLQRCRQVCKLWHKIIDSRSIRRQNALRCFHSKVHFEDSVRKPVMGFGFSFDQNNLVKTNMQYISYESWRHSQVRSAPLGESLQFFFPLMLTPDHANRSLPILKEMIEKLAESGVNYTEAIAVEEICGLMNRLILNIPFLIEQPGIRKKQLITRTIQFYCALHHAVLFLQSRQPRIKVEARNRVRRFLENPQSRQMQECLQLGMVLQYLSLTNYTWNQLRKPYMTEWFDRDAGEYVKEHPEIEDIDTAPTPKADPTFLKKVFEQTSKSRELLMYQAFFLTKICQPHGKKVDQVLQGYYKNLSGPPSGTFREMEEYVDKCRQVKDWQGFFNILYISPPNDAHMTKIFRDSVMRAAQKGYFEPKLLPQPSTWQQNQPQEQQRHDHRAGRGPNGSGPPSAPPEGGWHPNGPNQRRRGPRQQPRAGPPPTPNTNNRFPRPEQSKHVNGQSSRLNGVPNGGPPGPADLAARPNWATKRTSIVRSNHGSAAGRVGTFKKNLPAKLFADLPKYLSTALAKMKIIRERKFQVDALEALTSAQDCIIEQPLGSGRSTILAITALHRINPLNKSPQVVIIVPERLQAMHMKDMIMKIGCNMKGVEVVVCTGGVGANPVWRNIEDIKKGSQILIGTPGRLRSIISNERSPFKIDNCSAVFLMEADRLFDPGQNGPRRNQRPGDNMGSVKDQVTDVMSKVPQGIQVVVCTATMTEEIMRTAHTVVMNEKQIQVSEGFFNVSHNFVYVHHNAFRDEVLKKFVTDLPAQAKKAVIYVNQVSQMGRLQRMLEEIDGVKCVLMSPPSGPRRQPLTQEYQARGDALSQVVMGNKKGTTLLLCSDKIPTYNLHRAKLRIAINYDLPSQPDAYLRRASLASTIRSEGCFVLSFSTDVNEKHMLDIQNVCSVEFTELPANLEELL